VNPVAAERRHQDRHQAGTGQQAGVGSAFWGIVAGLLTLAVLNWGKR
jgi:hypothetical protein